VGADIHHSVAPLPGETVVEKVFPNSFRETPLQALLEQAGVREIVLCGAMTHMCIDATVRAAFDLGLRCTVVDDGCASCDLLFRGMKLGSSGGPWSVYGGVVSVVCGGENGGRSYQNTACRI
jgi:isochorismate hydrolase